MGSQLSKLRFSDKMWNMSLLTITDLVVKIENKKVLDDVSLKIEKGEVVAITGPNGSGKSTLANTLLGSKQLSVISGQIRFGGKDLLTMTVDERARAGLFVAWQTPVSIPGISVFTLCKTAYEVAGNTIVSVVGFKEKLEKLAERVGLTKNLISRNVNEGFSGGERKRLELLQLLLLSPKLAILDEIDSGLDQAGREMVVSVVEEMRVGGTAVMVISHYRELLTQITIDKLWEIRRGRIQTGI